MTDTSAILTEIAARYGVAVAPGVTVQRIAPGVSSRPLPVWDEAKNQLIIPDWKTMKEARKLAAIKRSAISRRRGQALDAALEARLRDMHGQGWRVPAMAAALEIGEAQCRATLSRLGLKIERVNPGPSPDTQRRVAEITRLTALGKSRAAIAEAAGFADSKHLAGFVHRSMPGFALPPGVQGQRKPRLMIGGQHVAGPGEARPAFDRSAYQREVQAARMAKRNAALRVMLDEGASEDAIAAALGITDRRYLRKLLHLKTGGEAVLPRKPRGDYTARDAAILDLLPSLAFPAIATRLALTVGQVAASVKRMRASGALPVAGALPRRIGRLRGAGYKVNVARNAGIMDQHRAGLTVEAIMAATGLARSVIARVVLKAGDSIRNERTTLPARRLSELPDLVARGLTGAEIAAHWDCPLSTVYGLASKAKVSLTGSAKAHNAGAVTPRVAARRALVAIMIRRGMTHVEMLEVLKVNQSTLSADIKAAGLSGQSAYAKGRAKGAAAATEDAERRAA